MDKITVSTQLLNQVLAYLGNRPFHEVFQLIQSLQQEAQSQLAPPPVETPVQLTQE